MALWYAATVSQCDCIAPERLRVYVDGGYSFAVLASRNERDPKAPFEFTVLNTRPMKELRPKTCRYSDRIVIWISLAGVAASASAHIVTLPHTSVLVVDTKHSRYVIVDSLGAQVHEAVFAKHDVKIDEWVKANFGATFARDAAPDWCPLELGGALSAQGAAWCSLWSAWWIHLLLMGNPTPSMSPATAARELRAYHGALKEFSAQHVALIPTDLPDNLVYEWMQNKITDIMTIRARLCKPPRQVLTLL